MLFFNKKFSDKETYKYIKKIKKDIKKYSSEECKHSYFIPARYANSEVIEYFKSEGFTVEKVDFFGYVICW